MRRANVANGPSSLSPNNSGIANVPPALTSDTMISLVPLPYFEEMQGHGGSSSSTLGVADYNIQANQSVPEAATTTSSYSDCLEGFPMHLLDMDIDDLPEY